MAFTYMNTPSDLISVAIPSSSIQRYPDVEVPELKPVISQLYDECLLLSRKILEMMGYALKLKVSISSIMVDHTYQIDLIMYTGSAVLQKGSPENGK